MEDELIMFPPPPSSSKPQNEKLVNAKVKSIISTVLERCKKESYSNSLIVPIEEYEQRASYYTAFPKSFFWELQDEEKNIKTEVSPFTTQQRIVILRCIKQFYSRKTQPTYMLLYDTVKMLIGMPEFLHFRREMSAIGYEYRNTPIGPLLVEDPKLRFERFIFLNKMRKIRSKNKPIYYIDIRILDKRLSFKNFTQAHRWSNSIEKLSYILLHAVSKTGLENSLYCNILTEEDFLKWVTDILLSDLKPGAVIVLPRNPFFTIPIQKPVTKYSTKSDMFKWLQENRIPCDFNMHKAELWELISISKVKSYNSKIDNILKGHGFEVLRLPYKFEDLTPTEHLWKHIQGNHSRINNPSMVELKCEVTRLIEEIDIAKWTDFSLTIESWEREIYELDEAIEIMLDNEYEFDLEQTVDNVSIPQYFYSIEM